MALALRPRIDFGSRASAMIAVAEDLGLPNNQVPSQGIANSHRTYLRFINNCRAILGLPLYRSLDYGSFTSALNAIAAAAGATKAENTSTPLITSNATPPIAGSILSSTTGIWLNAAGATYAYAWKRGATAVGTNSANYTVVTGDKTFPMTCEVTATTGAGASTPAISNQILVP